jgi:dUTP pyrophosphatase
MAMLFTKLSPNALAPTRGSQYAAGLDLYASIAGVVLPQQRLLVPLDISIQLPVGTYGHILPRSGLALKQGIHIGAGVIDEDYRGNVGVLLMNLGDQPFTFQAGDRIAQMVIKKYESVNVIESIVDDSLRGSGGFGSSGK